MNTAVSGNSGDNIPFSDADFKMLARLAKDEFGLNLAESKKPLVYSRLAKRLKARNVPSFPDYFSLLQKNGEGDERFELISALTTNVTSFFREMHHFDTLKSDCFPEMIDCAKSGGRLRIWSAGCSSGQEPYSIAYTLNDVFPDAGKFDCRILATDIDPKIVRKAKTGQYPETEKNGIKDSVSNRLFDNADGCLSVKENLKQMISFAELNLMNDWPFRGPFDVIFCRNVAIYFDQETQQRLWRRFCEYLRPGGHLFIGHSERITGPALESLTGVGITSYRKTANTGTNLPQ